MKGEIDMGFIAKVLSNTAKAFTGAGVISFSPHTLTDEPVCPDELL